MKIESEKKQAMINGFFAIVKIAVGCMFLWSSIPKIRQPYDFLSSVYSYEIVGPKLGMFVAMTLPWLEIIIGICLIGGIFISGALLASAAMAGLFSFVIGSAVYHGLDITCGCFGASASEVVDYTTLIRAVLILLLSAAAYWAEIFVPVPARS